MTCSSSYGPESEISYSSRCCLFQNMEETWTCLKCPIKLKEIACNFLTDAAIGRAAPSESLDCRLLCDVEEAGVLLDQLHRNIAVVENDLVCVGVVGGRLNPDEPQEVTANNISKSLFDLKNPTKVVIHGYASGMNLEQLADIRREYLKLGAYNLISPQYLELVEIPCYLTAVVNLDYVGKCIARFIRDANVIRRRKPLTASSTLPSHEILDLHLIGFSLGGQAAAFTANHLRPEFLLDRITGLDPAMPFFTTTDKDRKLSDDDALFVDVVHTNAFVNGQAERCGQVDFYMNGGMVQPGCSEAGFFNRMKCAHHRAPTYFAESVRSSTGFWGWACDSITDYDMDRCLASGAGVLAGEWVDRRSRGFFVVQTLTEAPYAMGRWWDNSSAEARASLIS